MRPAETADFTVTDARAARGRHLPRCTTRPTCARWTRRLRRWTCRPASPTTPMDLVGGIAQGAPQGGADASLDHPSRDPDDRRSGQALIGVGARAYAAGRSPPATSRSRRCSGRCSAPPSTTCGSAPRIGMQLCGARRRSPTGSVRCWRSSPTAARTATSRMSCSSRPRTVEKHVEHIRTKLGARSRAEAAATLGPRAPPEPPRDPVSAVRRSLVEPEAPLPVDALPERAAVGDERHPVVG